jgi:hypothetical protein
VGAIKTATVQVPLGGIDYVGHRCRTSWQRRAAAVAGSGRYKWLVIVAYEGDDFPPRVA